MRRTLPGNVFIILALDTVVHHCYTFIPPFMKNSGYTDVRWEKMVYKDCRE
jgi:hypothetical protein